MHVSDEPLPEDIPETCASTREDAQMDQSHSDCSDLTLGKVCFIFRCKYSPPSPRLLSISITCGDINNFVWNPQITCEVQTNDNVQNGVTVKCVITQLRWPLTWIPPHRDNYVEQNQSKNNCQNWCHKYLPPVVLISPNVTILVKNPRFRFCAELKLQILSYLLCFLGERWRTRTMWKH